MSTGRKVFRCAVDETALSTNISEIKKWTTNGAIDLVVPLYSEYPNVEEDSDCLIPARLPLTVVL